MRNPRFQEQTANPNLQIIRQNFECRPERVSWSRPANSVLRAVTPLFRSRIQGQIPRSKARSNATRH